MQVLEWLRWALGLLAPFILFPLPCDAGSNRPSWWGYRVWRYGPHGSWVAVSIICLKRLWIWHCRDPEPPSPVLIVLHPCGFQGSCIERQNGDLSPS